MAVRDTDYKLLWGRAAGRCSNPTCRTDLTFMLSDVEGFNVGEMAHIIAHSEGGPRGRKGGGTDDYGNLILLCPTCHRMIDKAPEGQFTEDMLLAWKRDHEQLIRTAGQAKTFASAAELKQFVRLKLVENRSIFESVGPHSKVATEDPGSNAHLLWVVRKLSTLVPNNREIINAIEGNIQLLQEEEWRTFMLFKNHAEAFEINQYSRLDSYPLFPDEFEEMISNG